MYTNDLCTKQMHYYQRSYFSWLEVHVSYTKINELGPQMCCNGFTYVMNDCSTIGDTLYLFSWLELYARYGRRVMDPNMHRKHFAIHHFVRIYTHNSKTTGCMWMFCLPNDCSTIGDVSKHASQFLSHKPFLLKQCT